MTSQELEVAEVGVGFVLEEPKPVDHRAMDGGEVGVIGFVAGIGGLAKLLGGEGMDYPDLKAGCLERGLDRQVKPLGRSQGQAAPPLDDAADE
ncbi:hypothetical protein SAMN05444166_1186 [Singulisphaera sp. GP187]|nr:hypothetical protein SAMN05444166_1186 [Singulisphaera sp. GP187]